MNWSVRELSQVSGAHRNTITNIETGKSAGDPQTLQAIRAALEAAGVVFLDPNGNGPGVALRKVE